MLSRRSIAFNAQSMGDWGNVARDSIILGTAPLFHITRFVSHLCMAIVEQAQFDSHLQLRSQGRQTMVRGGPTRDPGHQDA
jgi:hypothetical protein